MLQCFNKSTYIFQIVHLHIGILIMYLLVFPKNELDILFYYTLRQNHVILIDNKLVRMFLKNKLDKLREDPI